MPTQIIGTFDNELRQILSDRTDGPAVYIKGGVTVTTAAQTGSFPVGTKHVYLQSHNAAASATTVLYSFNPWLSVLRTTDGGVTFTDVSSNAQDDNLTNIVTLDSQDTIANGDALFVGSHLPFRGVSVDVDKANGTGSRTLTVSYWNNTTKAWVDAVNSNGTSGSTSLDQDGDETWTIASAWSITRLRDIFDAANEPFKPTYVQPTGSIEHTTPLYWTRWEWNGALDSEVELSSMLALNRSIAYAQLVITGDQVGRAVHRGFGEFGSIEYLTDLGTADLLITAGSGNGRFTS